MYRLVIWVTAIFSFANLTFSNTMNTVTCAPVIENVTVVRQFRSQQAVTAVMQDRLPQSAWKSRKLQQTSINNSGDKVLKTAAKVSAVLGGLIALVILIKLIWKLKSCADGNSPNQQAEIDNRLNLDWRPGNDIPNSLGCVRTFTMEELAKATYNFTTKIGEGGFGAVYRANLEDNSTVAVKRAKRGIVDQKTFKEELSVLLRVSHPYLVSLKGFCSERGEQFLVFEFVPRGSLHHRLHSEGNSMANPLPWACRMNIAFQVAVALEYLHTEADPPVIHRDIKSANVLLIDDNNAKLADFGLSKMGPKENQATSTALKGSFGYIDPEYIRTGNLSQKSDVYSFGVLLLELITGLKSVQGSMTLAEWTQSCLTD